MRQLAKAHPAGKNVRSDPGNIGRRHVVLPGMVSEEDARQIAKSFSSTDASSRGRLLVGDGPPEREAPTSLTAYLATFETLANALLRTAGHLHAHIDRIEGVGVGGPGSDPDGKAMAPASDGLHPTAARVLARLSELEYQLNHADRRLHDTL